MPSILAIETATEACSVALYHHDKISSRYNIAPQQHVSLILPMCDELLKEANILPSELSAIAFGSGPGSFTGVRIAAAVTQGIAVAHDLPVIAVSSLQALAQAVYIKLRAEYVMAGMDARMGEVYLGKFSLDQDHKIMSLLDKEVMISLEETKNLKQELELEPKSNWIFAGSAFQTESVFFPSAEAIIPVALYYWHQNNTLTPEMALPVYLRNNIVS